MLIGMVMVDVILIFTPGQAALLDDEMLAMSFAATNIDRLHGGAIGCTVPAGMIHHIERHPAVAYVRRVAAYTGSLSA